MVSSWLSQLKKQIRFYMDFWDFKRKGDLRFSLKWSERFPFLSDKTSSTSFDRHYVYHTAWAARILAKKKPSVHTDISSDLRFVTLVSAFLPIKFYDFRPPNFELSGLTSNHADITSLPFRDNSLMSLSCMHVIEHIGLGRYGDPLDPEGDLKAAIELQRVLASGGTLLIAVPLGKPVIMFNAHRIYNYKMVIDMFSELQLTEFTLIPDHTAKGHLIYNASPDMVKDEKYACGCFHFIKGS